jgi:hypothetical protein
MRVRSLEGGLSPAKVLTESTIAYSGEFLPARVPRRSGLLGLRACLNIRGAVKTLRVSESNLRKKGSPDCQE